MTTSLILQVVFWGSLLALGYGFAGYPLVSWVLAKLFPRPWDKRAPGEGLAVSVVLVVRDESERLRERLENLLSCDRPPGGFELIVVSDGSTDGTNEIVREGGCREVVLLEIEQSEGKSFCLNRGVEAASGEIVVFADARQQFGKDAIVKLVECFGDDRVGAVSGSLEIRGGGGGGLDAYWSLEKVLRRSEALRDSSIGCSGAIYAIRRELYDPIPPDTLLDDVLIPMQVALQGYRVVFESEATANDPQPLGGRREAARKMRTLAGNFQLLFRYPGWVLPWVNRLWWRLISHKYLRLLGPVLLVLLLTSNVCLRGMPFFGVILPVQMIFYAAGVTGLLAPSLKLRLFAVPAGFLFLNAMVVGGFFRYVRCRRRLVW